MDLYGVKHMTDTITDIIPFKSLDISDTELFLKDKIIKELDNKIGLYDNYLNDYASKNLNETVKDYRFN